MGVFFDYILGKLRLKDTSGGGGGGPYGDMFKAIHDPANLAQQVRVKSYYEDFSTISTRLDNQDMILGQSYVINDADSILGPAVKYIRLICESGTDLSGDPTLVFSQDGSVYLSEAKQWMPCSFDVKTKSFGINSVTKKIHLDGPQIRNLNSSPYVAIKGYAGLYAQIESVAAQFNYIAPEFDGAFDVAIGYESAGENLFAASNFFSGYGSDFGCAIYHVAYPNAQIRTFDENTDIVIKADGDSTVGNSTVDFYITYKYVFK